MTGHCTHELMAAVTACTNLAPDQASSTPSMAEGRAQLALYDCRVGESQVPLGYSILEAAHAPVGGSTLMHTQSELSELNGF